MRKENWINLKLNLICYSQSTPLCLWAIEQWIFCDCFSRVNLILRKGSGLMQ